MLSEKAQMKLAVFLPSLRGGGAERSMLSICRSMCKANVRVDLVLMTARGEYLNQIPPGVRLVDLNSPHLWTSLPSLIRYLRRERPDTICSAMPLANGIAAWARMLSMVNARLFPSEHNSESLIFGDIDVAKYHILPLLSGENSRKMV